MGLVCVHSVWGFHGANDKLFFIHTIKKNTCVLFHSSHCPCFGYQQSFCVPFYVEIVQCFCTLLVYYAGRDACRPYPTYLSTKLASLFEWAKKVTWLGTPNWIGNVTIDVPPPEWRLSWPYHCSNSWYCPSWMIKLLSSYVGL